MDPSGSWLENKVNKIRDVILDYNIYRSMSGSSWFKGT